MPMTLTTSTRSTFGHRRRGARRGGRALLPGLMLIAACGSENLQPPVRLAPSDVFWDLVVDHKAVTMSTAAPYDTLAVTALPRNYQGEALSGLPTPTYTSKDPARVVITPDGVLRALQVTSQPIPVVARLSAGGVTHADTLLVRVTDLASPPVLTTFSVHPVPPDSAKVGAGQYPAVARLPVRAADAEGAPIPDVLVAFHSSDTTTAQIGVAGSNTARFTGIVRGLRPGSVLVDARTTVYGVSMADTVPYKIGWMIFTGIMVDSAGVFRPSEIRIGTGGLVRWGGGFQPFEGAVDVTFADADLPNVASGKSALGVWKAVNALYSQFGFAFSDLELATQYCAFTNSDCDMAGNASVTFDSGAFRAFTAPGVYQYRSVQHGTSGRIVVVDEP